MNRSCTIYTHVPKTALQSMEFGTYKDISVTDVPSAFPLPKVSPLSLDLSLFRFLFPKPLSSKLRALHNQALVMAIKQLIISGSWYPLCPGKQGLSRQRRHF